MRRWNMHRAILTILFLLLFPCHALGFHTVWEQAMLVHPMDASETNHYENSPIQINLNTADKTLLQKITGVGPKKAEAIITYRQQHGAFKAVNDLLKIKGFSKAVVDKIIAKNPSSLVVN